MDDNPFDNLDTPSPTKAKTNPFDNLDAAPKAQGNPFEGLGATASQGRGMGNFPSLGGEPPNAPGTPQGQAGTTGFYDRLPGLAREVIGQAGPAMKALGQAGSNAPSPPPTPEADENSPFARLGKYLGSQSPDYLSNKIGDAVDTAAQKVEDISTFLLSKPSELVGAPKSVETSARSITHDVLGYLLGGDLAVHGTAAPRLAGEAPKVAEGTESIPRGQVVENGPMGLISRVESSNSNVPQKIRDINTLKGTPAQGYFQIIDPTWKAHAPPEIYAKYKSAIDAPYSVQAEVASNIKLKEWGPNTRAALKRMYPGIDLDQTLGEAQKTYGGKLRLVPGAPEGIRARATPTKEEVFAGKKNLSDDMLLAREDEIRTQLDRATLDDPEDTFGHAQDLMAEDALIKDHLNPEEPEAPSPNGVPPNLAAAKSLSAARTPVGRLAEQNIASFEIANKTPGFKQQVKDATSYARSFFADTDKGKAILQKNLGREKRIGAQAVFAMQKFKSMLNDATIDEQLDLLKWLQDPQSKLSVGKQLTPEAQSFVDTFHDWMQHYQKKLQTLPQAQKMNFRSNFVTQLWRQPKGAMAYINQYGAKRGSGYFTKARVFDDYEAGIRAGFAPVTTNPMELFSRYIENAAQKIAWWESINDAKNNGMVVYRAVQNAPVGWVEVKSMEPLIGQHAFAPPGLARIFDNYASTPKRFNIPGTQIDVLETAQRAANTATAFKLAISGFHPALETVEGLFSGVSNGITKLKNGRPVAGIAEVLTSARKPFTSVSRGRRLQKAYLEGSGTPEMQRVVDALTDANYDFMREGGLSDEYRVSRLPGFIKGWTKGIPMTAGGPLKMGIRAFETTMEPVFQYYVPWLKNQAAYDAMKTYLDAHPNLSNEEFAAYGRKVSNIMDARFGEMNKNNIFWDATSKRMAQTAAISWSFTLGQARQALGAAWDAARLPVKLYNKAKGTLPSTEEVWTDRLSYAVAVGLGTALINSVYQYLKTGQLPQDTQDLLHPRTGGIDPSTKKPERATLPNFANSYMNIWENGPGKEAYAKMAPLWQTLIDAGANSDWKGQPIRDPNDTIMAQLQQTAKFAFGNALTPITFGTIVTAKKGTNISAIELEFGLRPAGMRYTDPTTLKKIISYKEADAWYEKRKTDINQLRSQKGQPPLRLPYKTKQHLIERYMRNPQSDPLQRYGGTQ